MDGRGRKMAKGCEGRKHRVRYDWELVGREG